MSASFTKKLSWRVEAIAHSGVAALLSLLPAMTVYRFGTFAGKLLWPLMKKRRHFITRNLRIALAPLSVEEADIMARKSFVQTVTNLVSSAISEKSLGGSFEDMIEVENPELMEAAIAKGRGVILLSAHMGNWELLTRLNRTLPKGTNLGAFYRPLNNPILNERVLKERQADGTRLFSKRDSLHQVGSFLRENGVVGILADQRVGHQGEVCEFFGRMTRVSPLPSLLVRRCKSEVIAISLRAVAPGKWKARYHEVEEPYHSKTCMAALEEAMRTSPMDVFWLQERWKVYLCGLSMPFTKWLKRPNANGRLKHRIVIWQSGELPISVPEDYQHEDAVYETVVGKSFDELEAIDRRSELPIDFLITDDHSDAFRKHAKKLCIPIAPIQV